MELRIAKVISYLFHPLFIPFYAILVLLNPDGYLSLLIPLKGKLLLIGIVLLTTVLLPLFVSLILVRLKIIHSFFPKIREERIYLLLNVAIFYYLTYYLLKGIHVSLVFDYFMLGSTFLVICSLIITFLQDQPAYDCSRRLARGYSWIDRLPSRGCNRIHPGGYFLAGLIGTARLKIDSQKPGEVYYGFLVGITIMFLLFILI